MVRICRAAVALLLLKALLALGASLLPLYCGLHEIVKTEFAHFIISETLCPIRTFAF